jgi:RES domain-containing protein
MHVWRLTSRRHAAAAFSGIGNQKAGSRWVPLGLCAVYTSEHAATAVLEALVHMDPFHFSNRHLLIPADIPDEMRMETIDIARLPSDWPTRYEDPLLQQIGEDWIRRAETAFLIVPCAVVPEERNIIVNPQHSDFHSVGILPPREFHFDARLRVGSW